ncbi:MAG: M48 family metallopeptidase [Burkholderiaceae bacterium]
MQAKWVGMLLPVALVVSGCKTMDMGSAMNAGADLTKAATLSDADVAAMSDQACAHEDKRNRPASAAYQQRLDRLVAAHRGEDGLKLSFKAYQNPSVNAWAMANGCVRVYTGLMDLMNDDELRGVIGHEIGHVKLGHSKNAMRTAYAASAARQAAASTGNSAVAALSASQLGDLAEKLINAQFSQSQESDSDQYALGFMRKHRYKAEGLVSAFTKLSKLSGDAKSSMFDSHPGSADRAQRIQEQLNRK